MQREIIITKDGSHSVSVPALNVTYHSIHGALQESLHVFITAGFHYIKNVFPETPLHILEVGFGTGLNAFLTMQESARLQRPIHYTALELYPLEEEKVNQLNYASAEEEQHFRLLHAREWEKDDPVTPLFTIHKKNTSLLEFSSSPAFHLIYFDAFAPAAQPELWTQNVFERLQTAMLPSSVLVTYCSKGDVRRAMEAAGLKVEKIQGPPGKREMVRAHRK